jgi:GNAT superfamily N-acetyltransferase
MLTFDIFSNEADTLDVLALVVKHLETAPLAKHGIDEAHVYDLILTFRSRDRVIFLLREEDKIVGYLAAAASPHPLFPAIKTAAQWGWYVAPEHRKEASWSLIDAYEQWAETIGCNLITLANYNTPKLSEAYEARGFVHVEQSFIKELA